MIKIKTLKNLFFSLFGEWTPGEPTISWERRANLAGFYSVMWRNAYYNRLAHNDQISTIVKWLPQNKKKEVLDLGCGIGRLSGVLSRHFDLVVGMDIEKMVFEAKKRNDFGNVSYLASTVKDLAFKKDSFDLILSMGCLSAACLAEELPNVLGGIWHWIRPGGRLILIDPFHKWSFLARQCRLDWRDVARVLEDNNYRILHLGGLHFSLFRILLTFNQTSNWKVITNILYRLGEDFLRITSPIKFSDYKVIVGEKNYEKTGKE